MKRESRVNPSLSLTSSVSRRRSPRMHSAARTHRVMKKSSSDAAAVKAAETFEKMWRERVGTDTILRSIAQANSSSSGGGVNLDGIDLKNFDPNQFQSAQQQQQQQQHRHQGKAASSASPASGSSFTQQQAQLLDASGVPSAVSGLSQSLLSSAERAAIAAQFQEGVLQIPRDLTRIRVGLSTALRLSISIPDDMLFDLLCVGRVGPNLLRQKTVQTREATVQSLLDVALWIKHQFLQDDIAEASGEDSPHRELLENAVCEVTDSVALFEAASVQHLAARLQSAAARSFGRPGMGAGAGVGTAMATNMRLTPRAALACLQCEPPVPSQGSRQKRLNSIFIRKDSMTGIHGKSQEGQTSSSESSDEEREAGRGSGGARRGSRHQDDDHHHHHGGDLDHDDGESDADHHNNSDSNKNNNDNESNNSDLGDASVSPSPGGRTPSPLRRRGSIRRTEQSASHQRQRSPDAEARKELRGFMAADPWRQTAAALFAFLGGEVFGTYGSLPFPVVERVVRLVAHRRVESAAVEGAVASLASKYEGRRLSLVEFDHDVVRPLARLLGCDTTQKSGQQQADIGVSSQIRAAQHVIRLFMTPASKLQRDDARFRSKKTFANSDELMDAAKFSFSKVSKRLKELKTIDPHIDRIFKTPCILEGTGLTHVLDLSRFTLMDFVQKVKDNRPIAINPAMALRQKIVDRFTAVVDRAARTLFDHSANCSRCKDIAEVLRNAINEQRKKDQSQAPQLSAVQRQETLLRRSSIDQSFAVSVGNASMRSITSAPRQSSINLGSSQHQKEGGEARLGASSSSSDPDSSPSPKQDRQQQERGGEQGLKVSFGFDDAAWMGSGSLSSLPYNDSIIMAGNESFSQTTPPVGGGNNNNNNNKNVSSDGAEKERAAAALPAGLIPRPNSSCEELPPEKDTATCPPSLGNSKPPSSRSCSSSLSTASSSSLTSSIYSSSSVSSSTPGNTKEQQKPSSSSRHLTKKEGQPENVVRTAKRTVVRLPSGLRRPTTPGKNQQRTNSPQQKENTRTDRERKTNDTASSKKQTQKKNKSPSRRSPTGQPVRFAPAPPNVVPCSANLTRRNCGTMTTEEASEQTACRQRSGQVREIFRIIRLKNTHAAKSKNEDEVDPTLFYPKWV